MNELLNCPFCGTAAMLVEKFIGDDVDSYWDVECTNNYCYLWGGAEWCFDTKAEASTKWNTRTPDLAEDNRAGAVAADTLICALREDNRKLKQQVADLQSYGCFVPDEDNTICLIAKDNKKLKAALDHADAALDDWGGDKEKQLIIENLVMFLRRIFAGHKIQDKVEDYFSRKGIPNSPLREPTSDGFSGVDRETT